jgi:hypothetical protein
VQGIRGRNFIDGLEFHRFNHDSLLGNKKTQQSFGSDAKNTLEGAQENFVFSTLLRYGVEVF